MLAGQVLHTVVETTESFFSFPLYLLLCLHCTDEAHIGRNSASSLQVQIYEHVNVFLLFILPGFKHFAESPRMTNESLTRSLPRDVYIRRQNDHPGGQGRIYTSHLNFISTHLSKPGHRRGCCCMSPRCLLHQFVDRCLLFWAFFIEKTVLLCFARFLSKWRETALWLFPDATDDKLVRAVRLMAFVTTAIEERAQLVSSC